jgi:hypothetical protein
MTFQGWPPSWVPANKNSHFTRSPSARHPPFTLFGPRRADSFANSCLFVATLNAFRMLSVSAREVLEGKDPASVRHDAGYLRIYFPSQIYYPSRNPVTITAISCN